jgi:formiminoglutamase
VIDLKSYFSPLEEEIYQKDYEWESTQFGSLVSAFNLIDFPEYKFCEIAIFSVFEYNGTENVFSGNNCKIRKKLYHLHSDKIPRICDLGFLKLSDNRKDTFKNLENVCKELLHNGIFPLVIGGGHDLTYAIYKSFSSLNKNITLTTVDSKFDIGMKNDNISNQSFFGKILEAKPNNLFHYSNIGYQSFFVSPLALEMLEELSFETMRLGDVIADIKNIEPVMRNTDFLSLDISSIKHSDSSANFYSSPNGLNGLEACQIMRYAGLSDKLSSLVLCEYNQLLDKNGQSAQLISQMIWYFIMGYKSRKNELNPNIKNCIKYTVSFEDGKNEIVFYKSNLSSRWWMGIPYKNSEKSQLDCYFVACSYADYEQANIGEIPSRWINTYNKLT